MAKHLCHVLALLLCLLAPSVFAEVNTEPAPAPASPPAAGSAPESARPCVFCRDYAQVLVDDARYVLTAPAHWSTPEWATFSRDALIVVGSMALLDKRAQDAVQRNRNSTTDDIARAIEPFGERYSFAVIGGFYVAGAALDDPKAIGVARDGLTSSLIAAGVIAPAMKIAFGRSRPREDKGAYDFHPFHGGASFPSGHTTQAFAVASVVAESYDSVWIKTLSYGTASLVGGARIVHNAHFLSDVLAGAMIGTGVGKAVVHFNGKKTDSVSVLPIVQSGGAGIVVAWSF